MGEFNLPHRDDVPLDALQQLTEKLQEDHPGAKIVFAGDIPGEVSPEIKEEFERVQREIERSIEEGSCLHCKKRIPNIVAGDRLPEGWDALLDLKDNAAGFICSDCKSKLFFTTGSDG